MSKYYLSEKTLSRMFWETLHTTPLLEIAQKDIELIVDESHVIRKSFPKEVAGTISEKSALELWLIARYFAPREIFEIGTFIGRSTMALLAGASETLSRIDTCDFSHDTFYLTENFRTRWPASAVINYWKKTPSSVALAEVIKQGGRPDLLFIDGRLGDQDLKLLSYLDRKKTVYVFDDFEGIEKGVENCLSVRQHFPELLLLRPSHSHANGAGHIAILVPPTIITLTKQQDLPISLQR
jgi:predicted O-methyltransferase YrrM